VSSDKERYVTRLASNDRRGDKRKYSCTFSSSAGSMHRSKRANRHYKSRHVSKSVIRGSFQRDVSSSSQSCSSKNHVIKTVPKAKKEGPYPSKYYGKGKGDSLSKDCVKKRYAPIHVSEISHGRGVFSDKWTSDKRSPRRRHMTEGVISSYSMKYSRQTNPVYKKYDTSRRGTFHAQTLHPSPRNRFAHTHSNNTSPPPLIAPASCNFIKSE
jgi:hypothetical protein